MRVRVTVREVQRRINDHRRLRNEAVACRRRTAARARSQEEARGRSRALCAALSEIMDINACREFIQSILITHTLSGD